MQKWVYRVLVCVVLVGGSWSVQAYHGLSAHDAPRWVRCHAMHERDGDLGL